MWWLGAVLAKPPCWNLQWVYDRELLLSRPLLLTQRVGKGGKLRHCMLARIQATSVSVTSFFGNTAWKCDFPSCAPREKETWSLLLVWNGAQADKPAPPLFNHFAKKTWTLVNLHQCRLSVLPVWAALRRPLFRLECTSAAERWGTSLRRPSARRSRHLSTIAAELSPSERRVLLNSHGLSALLPEKATLVVSCCSTAFFFRSFWLRTRRNSD